VEAIIISASPARLALVVIPVHANRDLPAGTVRAVARQAGLSVEELAALL
jgi:hypothetical protein